MVRNYWEEWKSRTKEQVEAEIRANERRREEIETAAREDPNAVWCVAKCGEIGFKGTLTECEEIISKDMTGELEIYPMSAYRGY